MVKQYPHKLTATIVSESYRDANGNWVQGSTTSLDVECRAEPNIRASYQLTGADGNRIQFDWTVYMRYGAPQIPDGTEIIIMDGADVRASGKSIRFSRGQLNTRLWI